METGIHEHSQGNACNDEDPGNQAKRTFNSHNSLHFMDLRRNPSADTSTATLFNVDSLYHRASGFDAGAFWARRLAVM